MNGVLPHIPSVNICNNIVKQQIPPNQSFNKRLNLESVNIAYTAFLLERVVIFCSLLFTPDTLTKSYLLKHVIDTFYLGNNARLRHLAQPPSDRMCLMAPV